MDIWIDREEENIDKLMQVVKAFGDPHAKINKKDLLKEPTLNPSPGVGFGREPMRLEILSAIDGVSFKDCINKVEVKELAGVLLKYIHYDDLKKNKLSTGRTKDKADIEALERKRRP